MSKPLVAILMGSSNDWDIMQQAARPLHDFGVAYDARVISAHRSPELLLTYVQEMSEQGVQCFIAGAGGAAHLAGVIARVFLPFPDFFEELLAAEVVARNALGVQLALDDDLGRDTGVVGARLP